MSRDIREETDASDYSERRITQMRELKTLFWGLDHDEGLRFVSDSAGFESGAFVFVTKTEDRFCINVRERVLDEKSKQFVPGHREQWKYFETAESAWNYTSKFLKSPLEVYYY